MKRPTRQGVLMGISLTLGLGLLLGSCSPSVQLKGSWSKTRLGPLSFSRILVLSMGSDLKKRKLGEDALRDELNRYGFRAAASLDLFPAGFSKGRDSASLRRELLDQGFDGVITLRVLRVTEKDRWIPVYPLKGPQDKYRGLYRYYFREYGYYARPGNRVRDIEVLLESNLYEVSSGQLLWTAQSAAFSRNPNRDMAARYARNIAQDLIEKRILKTN